MVAPMYKHSVESFARVAVTDWLGSRRYDRILSLATSLPPAKGDPSRPTETGLRETDDCCLFFYEVRQRNQLAAPSHGAPQHGAGTMTCAFSAERHRRRNAMWLSSARRDGRPSARSASSARQNPLQEAMHKYYGTAGLQVPDVDAGSKRNSIVSL